MNDFDFSDEGGVVKHNINDVRPTSINHLIGQDHVRQVVSVALDAAFQDGRRFDHALLTGFPGAGKTNFSQVIAHEMASGFHELLGQSIRNVGDLNAVLLAAKEKDVVLIDECHELDKSIQTALYLALDQRKILVPGSRQGSSPMSIPIADFTLLLATTHEFQVLQPLRDRMKLLLRFDFYAPEELEQIVRQRSLGLGWDVEADVPLAVSLLSRGVPRLALRILESARRVARSLGDSVTRLEHLHTACKLEQIDSIGLGPMEQKYLSIVAEGPTRLNVIGSRLGLPSRTVHEVTESFLLRANLIIKDENSRRQLTALGREHLANGSHIHVQLRGQS